jgi:hypothetical protein
MDLVSLCPLRAVSFVWRRGAGYARTVVCKATFELRPEQARLAEQQEPLHEIDEHWDDDPARSLYASTDFVPHKARADVLLVGRAFAPSNEPVAALVARLIVGSLDKAIEVHRNRTWSDAGRVVDGPAFTSMPLVYERAAGGPGTWNPVGVDAEARPGLDGLARMPNLMPLGFKLAARGARIPPVGFGPIAPTWPNRIARFGPHASLASEPIGIGGPIRTIPDELDAGCFNAAPTDQQPSALRADERIVLDNLDPHHGRLSTTLPGLRPRIFVDAAQGGRQELAMVVDTLWIDTDRRICTLTWRGTLAVPDPEAKGRIVVAVEAPGQNLAWADLLARGAMGTAVPEARAKPDVEAIHVEGADADAELTLRPRRDRKPVLPFHPAPSAFPPPPLPVMVPPTAPDTTPEAPPRGSRIGAWSPPGSITEAKAPAFMSALAVSNAAAASAGADAAQEAAVSGVTTRRRPGEVLELLWCDAAVLPRARAKPAWKKLLVSAKPSDEEGASRDKSKAAKDQRDIVSILSHGEALDAQGLDVAHDAAIEDGTFAPPIVLVAGEVVLPFDEREALKATLALVAPFASTDKKLKEQCDTTRELLESPWLEKGSAGLDGLATSLRDAFAKTARGISPASIEAQTERILLEQRRYQKRTLLGEEWVRALLTLDGAEHGVPLYLPEPAAKQLPMFARFRATILAELRLQLDQNETCESALRAVAVGRLFARTRRA